MIPDDSGEFHRLWTRRDLVAKSERKMTKNIHFIHLTYGLSSSAAALCHNHPPPTLIESPARFPFLFISVRTPVCTSPIQMAQSLDCLSEISTRKRNEEKRKYYSSMEGCMYTFFPSSCQPPTPTLKATHNSTARSNRSSGKRTSSARTTTRRRNKCGRRKKCFSFRVLLGSSQCYMANGERRAGEWEATTENVY